MLIVLSLLACWVSDSETGPGICISVTSHRPFVVEVDGEAIIAGSGEVVDVCAEDGAFVEIYDYIDPTLPP